MGWEARTGGWDTRGPKVGGTPKNSGRPGGSGSLQNNWRPGGVGVPRRVNGRPKSSGRLGGVRRWQRVGG